MLTWKRLPPFTEPVPSVNRKIGRQRQIIDDHGAIIDKLHDYVIPRGKYISIWVIFRANKLKQLWIVISYRKLPLDGIDEVCQDLVRLHLPPPIRDDSTIIVLWFEEDSGRMTTAMPGEIDVVVLPIFYQALDSDAITLNHLGTSACMDRTPR